MEMTWATTWWLVCGALIAVELATGTFYLLMLALGFAAAALSAHLGLSSSLQIVVAAVVGGAAVVLWHRLRQRHPPALPAGQNPDVNLDIGQAVQVDQWTADGQAQVKYRGAEWQARFAGQGSPNAGRFIIRAVEGSCLQLDH